jgi:hypothetical protein
MNSYTPDRWIILKLTNNSNVFYKVMGGWIGGYLDGDSWRINSGRSKVEFDGDFYKFYGHSGSVYICHKDKYGTTSLMSSVLPKSDEIEILPNSDFTLLVKEIEDETK